MTTKTESETIVPQTPDPEPASPKRVDSAGIPVDPGLEAWRNTLRGRVIVMRTVAYGEVVREVISGGATFFITPADRRMNQAKAATPPQDVFTNGTLEPVSLIDSEPDTAKLLANPNILSSAQMRRMFRIKGDAFAESVSKITHAATLARMREMCENPGIDARISQVSAIDARIAAVSSKTSDSIRTNEATVQHGPDGEVIPKAVMPR
jgi:hypothetical protein